MRKGSPDIMTWPRPNALWLKFTAVLAAGWLILALALRLLAGRSGFHVIDMTQPIAPVDLGLIEELGGKRYASVEDMMVAGDRLYVTTASDGFYVFDISTPAQPVEIGLSPLSCTEKVGVRNGIIYVSCGSAGLYLFQTTP